MTAFRFELEEALMDAQPADNRKRVLIAIGAVAAVIAVVLATLVLTNDDEPVSSDDTTTTTESTTTSSTTTSTSTTLPFEEVDPDVPLFPDPTTSQRFDDPVALALAFGTWAGYREPIAGEFQQGDARSGEIELRAFAQGSPSLVLVRQLEDDHWYVIGVSTDSIVLTTPQIGDTLTSPQPLEGQAYAFEGTVQVRLYADGVQEPIGETFVTGRGDGVLGDFSGELTFTNDTGATHGVLALYSAGGEDGSTIEVSAIRVRL